MVIIYMTKWDFLFVLAHLQAVKRSTSRKIVHADDQRPLSIICTNKWVYLCNVISNLNIGFKK